MSPTDIVFLGTSLVKCGVVVGVVLFMVAYSVMAERRVSAMIQDRIGPNRTGIPLTKIRLFGLGQPVADGIKFLLKEELTPAHVNKLYFTLAPILTMVPALVTIAVVPFGSVLDLRPFAEWIAEWGRTSFAAGFGSETVQEAIRSFFAWDRATIEAFHIKAVIADLNVGILFLFAIVSISVYGIVIAGWASNSKYPFLGGIRSSAQMISYELSMGLAVVPLFLILGKLNLGDIVFYQAKEGWLVLPLVTLFDGGTMTTKEFLLWIPLGISFLIFLISAFAETNRLPFDLPECETELVGGYHTEYAAMKFALFFLGEYAAMIVTSSIMVTLFFGGWYFPGVPVEIDGGVPLWLGLVHILMFLIKVSAFIFVFIWVRWTLPRFRYDQLMNLGWKFFIPVGFANVFLAAFLMAYL